MSVKIGYLLPTRERIMNGQPEGAPLLDLAERAADFGFDSVWVGDSLLAKPRHEPLTVLAGVAGRVPNLEIGTAVLLPALRNPVLLAHQLATLDQISEGRLIVGAGIAADLPAIRAEFAAAGVPFEKRVGRMLEGFRLCRALWSGEAVTWEGRWQVTDGALAPTPYRPGGPPIWIGSHVRAGFERAARHFDGWFPTGPDAVTFGQRWCDVQDLARDAGRPPNALTAAVYLTAAVDEDPARGDARLNEYLERYYSLPAAKIRKQQACFAGSLGEAVAWMRSYVEAGAQHLVLRLVGEHVPLLEKISRVRSDIA